nr:MAG TPA: hypothetical protein [Caudoviricetes sp.]
MLTCCFSVKTSLFYSILFLRISFYPPYIRDIETFSRA